MSVCVFVMQRGLRIFLYCSRSNLMERYKKAGQNFKPLATLRLLRSLNVLRITCFLKEVEIRLQIITADYYDSVLMSMTFFEDLRMELQLFL